ncbi:MAG TPA: cupin domain-containing protein [Pyrinomonadaceae bacterium]|jgi:quercetin dioxygenase-like cupin family protein|nr:cupin domain-containing protein [Pyrinomonadaceae bacterium]
MNPVILQPGEGERIAAGASTAVMKATAETTDGAFSISEATFPAGMNGPPPHSHRYTTDTFYVLEGTLHVTVGDREIDASAGSYILVPPGVVHTFANISDEPVRFLNISAPGGLEKYLRDLADAIRLSTMPGTPDFAAIVAKHDFVVPT